MKGKVEGLIGEHGITFMPAGVDPIGDIKAMKVSEQGRVYAVLDFEASKAAIIEALSDPDVRAAIKDALCHE